jgi:mannosyltransferase
MSISSLIGKVREKYLTFSLFLGSLILRLAWLGRKSYWVDEITTLRIASQGITELLVPSRDPHPPLYYLVMSGWCQYGRGEFWTRIPSAVFGALAIPFVYGIGKIWAGRASGFWAAVLFALSPLHLYYSQEARMYSLATMLAVTAVYCWSRGLREGSWSAWVAYSVLMVLGLYTHYSLILMYIFQWLAFLFYTLLLKRQNSIRWAGIVSQILVGLAFVPWIPTFLQHVGTLNPENEIFMRIAGVLREGNLEVTARGVWWVVIVGGISLIALTISVLFGLLRKDRFRSRRSRRLIVGVLALVYLLATFSMVLTRALSLKRQSLIYLPFFLLLLAWSIEWLGGRKRLRYVLVLAALPFTLLNLVYLQKEDWRSAAAWIGSQRRDGQIIFFYPPWYREPFDYYYDGKATYIPLPYSSDAVEAIDEHLTGKHAWLVMDTTDVSPGAALLREWVRGRAETWKERSFANVSVQAPAAHLERN